MLCWVLVTLTVMTITTSLWRWAAGRDAAEWRDSVERLGVDRVGDIIAEHAIVAIREEKYNWASKEPRKRLDELVAALHSRGIIPTEVVDAARRAVIRHLYC